MIAGTNAQTVWMTKDAYAKANEPKELSFGIRDKNGETLQYYIQFKRYANIVKHDPTIIVDKVSANSVIPDNLWVILGCDITRVNYEYLKQYATLRDLKKLNCGLTIA